ncbi:hypothetical protein DPMN_185900 [Dreissena polymorpha]|uniref:Uncharacterized protein n=1 Tax=Dreissena polymorpha TaxID=45954 RepID=A0A9D4I946_DREPO|nr:hypothetical protein DPMN_185900 [Dreissena polymorpha]
MIAFISITSHTNAIPTWLWVASSAVAKCSIIWNPIIYIARNRPFKTAAKNILTTLAHLQTSRTASQQRGGSGYTLEVLPQVDQETNMIEMD